MDQDEVRLRGNLVKIPDEPSHLAGRGIEERGDRWVLQFARGGSLIWNEKRILSQMSAPRLAEINIEERGKHRGRMYVEGLVLE